MIEKVRCDGETETLKLDDSLTEIIIPRSTSLYLNLYSSHVPAGFPSPAENYVERTLDLNEYLISNPAATFFVRVSGDSMIGAGIHSNDILIVDRSREVKDNKSSTGLAVMLVLYSTFRPGS